MSAFPTAPERLTAGWLSAALGRRVPGFEIERFSEGAGVIGLVTRVRLRSETKPQSVIAKFPSPAAENRAVAEAYDMYGREVRFYQHLAERVPVRTPACYFADFDPATHDFVLLLEDLTGYRIGDQVAGCTLEEARAVIDAVAHLHASTWGATGFDVILHDNPMQRDGMIGGFRLGWPVVLEEFGDLVSEPARAAGGRMPEVIPRLLARMCQPPLCIAHADVRLDNVFFGENGEVALVDWQSICRSAPEQDLAYFLTQSVPSPVRRREDLVARYHARLTAHGVAYELGACRARYRLCALYLLCYAVVIAGTLDMGNARGRTLARTLLGSSLGALAELDAFALLEE